MTCFSMFLPLGLLMLQPSWHREYLHYGAPHCWEAHTARCAGTLTMTDGLISRNTSAVLSARAFSGTAAMVARALLQAASPMKTVSEGHCRTWFFRRPALLTLRR